MRWRNLRKVCNSYIFTNQKLDANQDLRRKKIQELVALVQEHCLAGEAMDIGQAAFTTALNALSNSIFSLNLSDSNSETASQLKEVVGGIMEEAGKPNLADYFPVLRRIDLQGIKRRMTIHFGKILNIFDGIVNERLQLRKMQGYVPVNDMLDTLLTISEDNNEDIMETSQIKHLFLVTSFSPPFANCFIYVFPLKFLNFLYILREFSLLTSLFVTGFICCWYRYNF
jgi:cytochrome P450